MPETPNFLSLITGSFASPAAEKPKRRLFEVLKSQAMQANQQVTFLTDGGEDIRDLPLYEPAEKAASRDSAQRGSRSWQCPWSARFTLRSGPA